MDVSLFPYGNPVLLCSAPTAISIEAIPIKKCTPLSTDTLAFPTKSRYKKVEGAWTFHCSPPGNPSCSARLWRRHLQTKNHQVFEKSLRFCAQIHLGSSKNRLLAVYNPKSEVLSSGFSLLLILPPRRERIVVTL